MALKIFKTKDEVPEAQREAAIALADGTFGVVEETDTTPLQQELADLRRKLEAADKLSKKAAAEAAAAELARKAAEQGVTAEALEKIRADVRKEVESEFLPKLEAATAAQTELRVLKVDTRVKEIALKNGVRPDRINQWWALNGHHYDLTADGKAVVVKGQEGTSVEKHVLTLKDDTPEFYVGTKAAGSSASGGGGGNAGGGDKIDVLQNPGAALAAARAAGRTE